MKNTVKELLQSGGHALGMFYELGGTAAAESLGLAGLDFFIIDCEHGSFDVESAQLAILASECRHCTPFVRVKDTSRSSLLKMLDVGAMGLIVPCIHSVEDAKALVQHAKYAPLGARGFAPARVSGFGQEPYARDIKTQCETANRETLLLPQCETAGAFAQIEEIAALPGVDGIFIGPYDLSFALGMPGEFSSPAFVAAIDRIRNACKDAKKFSIMYANNAEQARAYFAQGFDAVVVGMDVMLLIDALKQLKRSVFE